MKSSVLLFLLPLWLASVLFSCRQMPGRSEAVLADSLNRMSYRYHYRDLDSTRLYAEWALDVAAGEPTATAEAYNNLAFYAFMRMDFGHSKACLEKVYATCRNELELLVADVGMMKICQRTSANKDFYDYRNSALRRMERIDEEQTALSRQERMRLLFARSEFHIVSSIYFFYLQQLPQSQEEIEQARRLPLWYDTGQWLYYLYMKGSGGLCTGPDADAVAVEEFDYLSRCLSDGVGYVYFEANSLQAFAESLSDTRRMDVLRRERPALWKLLNAENVPDSLLPVSLARQALTLFRSYGDIYQIAGAYRTLGTCLIRRGHYAEAVDTLQRALDYVSFHHYHYYACTDSVHRLLACPRADSIPLELCWMNSREVQTVPEWIARIREQLSIAYAGLGMKAESDYNRNVYLDILDITRQDKELESRYERLERESAQLDVWLAVVVVGVLLVSVVFVVLNRRWRRNNALHVEKLKLALAFCRKLLAAVPQTGVDEADVPACLLDTVQADAERLFGCRLVLAGTGEEADLKPDRKLSEDGRALLDAIRPYWQHAVRNARYFAMLGGEYRQLEKEKYVYEQHIIDNKRQNVVKKACVSIVTGIVPYIDRIINEVHKLLTLGYLERSDVKCGKYRYIDELATRINEYNEILALWIKMRQGTLSLNVETFALEELFAILAKGRKAFDAKHQTLDVCPTTAWVKADKALTLFMINTLMENARKYTPEGGRVEVKAVETDVYVEISVTDNGRGLSEADVDRIVNEKVYDPATIGLDGTDADEELRRNKGSGFGLMNCKGIIEKYRKTNELFRVCLFAVESRPGKGSRFYFRLPRGLRRGLVCLIGVLGVCLSGGCSPSQSGAKPESEDAALSYYDAHLELAAAYADSAYYANVYREHRLALAYADSVVCYLNRHYAEKASRPDVFMSLRGAGDAAEILWWNERFDTDYHVILDVRNEAAVAALAVKDWDTYQYNNTAYTYLYKLLSRDTSLEKYCVKMEHSSANRAVSIILCVALLLVFLVGYYWLYFRHRMLYRFNLEQMLQVSQQMLRTSMNSMEAGDDWQTVWKNLLREAFADMNDWLPMHTWGLTVFREEKHRMEPVFYPFLPAYTNLSHWVDECFATRVSLSSDDGCVGCFPLYTEDEAQCLGVFVVQAERKLRPEETLLLELMARYVSILLMNNTIRVGQTFRDLELMHDDKARARREEATLHIQNMVLDNCLSTIKHETLYYPNRIKQIADRLLGGLPYEEEVRQVKAMEELVSYYKDVFTLLSSCAVRQLEDVTFRRQSVAVSELVAWAVKYVKRKNKKSSFVLDLQVQACDARLTGDKVLLAFLMENLLEAAYAVPEEGRLCLQVEEDEAFIRFSFIDERRSLSQEELNELFYPSLERMKGSDGRLAGTEYLVCKQIIREHDEYTGRRGCRINARPALGGGFTVWFTLPCVSKRERV